MMPHEDFVTSQDFQRIAAHHVQSPRFDASAVKPGDVIYSRHWIREWTQWRPLVRVPYQLLSNFHDRSIAGAMAEKILDDPLLERWYGVNAALVHPKLTPIPFGLRVRPPRGLAPAPVREILCYANFSRYTADRRALWAWAETQPFVWCQVWEKRGLTTYWQDLARSQFVLCPSGFGMDTWRIWEALALGAVPICRHSPLDQVLEGLPVMRVQAWENMTEDSLCMTAAVMADACATRHERLTRGYWSAVITGRDLEGSALRRSEDG